MADPFQDRTAENHPSFVTVQFSRLSGSKRFFGSSVTSHSWIRLQIRPATLYHYLGEDSIYATNRSLVEVDLSPAQFAELLTTMNVGSGVPGTLIRFDGKKVEEADRYKVNNSPSR